MKASPSIIDRFARLSGQKVKHYRSPPARCADKFVLLNGHLSAYSRTLFKASTHTGAVPWILHSLTKLFEKGDTQTLIPSTHVYKSYVVNIHIAKLTRYVGYHIPRLGHSSWRLLYYLKEAAGDVIIRESLHV